MNIWIWIGIIAVVAVIVVLFLRNKRIGSFKPGGMFGADPSVFNRRVIFEDRGHTPAGRKVWAFHNPSESARQLADDGIRRTHEIARNVYGYSGFRDNYSIGFFPRSNVCEQAAFLIEQDVEPGTNYDGSIYDKDPRPGKLRLCVAGMFELVNLEPVMFVVDDPAMTLNAAAYEAEHAVLLDADRDKFIETQYHQTGGHPILPDTRARNLTFQHKHEGSEITLADGSKVCALLTR